jgi:hypothetical protein
MSIPVKTISIVSELKGHIENWEATGMGCV